MSYPYLSDLINHLFGTNIQLPIAMFGAFVALAIITAAWVGKKEVMRFERLGKLPSTVISGNKSITTHLLVSDLAMICAIYGVIGAHIFHLLEYPRELVQDPIAMIFSLDGFSIYGGLILGAIAGAIFLNKRAVPIIPMLDALAPSIILGYGIGRLGCQVSGDGDWGTAANMAIKPNWLPDWFWTQTYENNVVGTIIPAPGVYPTPLLLSGFERLLIEKIRINSEYHLWGMNFTQAEFISTALIIAGVVGIIKTTNARLLPRIVFSVVVIGALSACAQL
jgi:phosphatidylglycerol:prolipoprotein diacylglycerol transferase